VMQLDQDKTCALWVGCRTSLPMLGLLCAYAPLPSLEMLREHLANEEHPELPHECVEYLEVTSNWTTQLHHFEFLPIERVRALLVEGANVHASNGEAGAPTPLSLAQRLRALTICSAHAAAALIIAAAAPWSPTTHALFPAAAKARAIELLRVGWLLARCIQSCVADASDVEMAFRDVWLSHIMPHAIERSSG
jgi:hypothetical protein